MAAVPTTLGLILAGALVLGLAAAPRTFWNPLASGADPCLTFDKGWAYLAVTTGRDLRIRRARRLADLRDAIPTTVYRSDDPAQATDVWAPEFHRFGGKWYLYFAAGDGTGEGHRIWVAEGQGDTPLGPYVLKAKLRTDPADAFYAIDPHPFQMPDGRLYLAWCGRPSDTYESLYLSRMANPWTLAGDRRKLDVSGVGCPYVREAPETLQHDGRLFLAYSACGTDSPDYRLGLTAMDAKGDPLDPAAWHDSPTPILTRNDAAGVYGPGHNIFFRSPDGKEDWNAYHVKTTTKPIYDDREIHASRVRWKNGMPDLGTPVADGSDVPAPSGER